MKALLAAAVMLIAAESHADDSLPTRGRSAAELLALKVADFSTTMTTTRGELELRTKELAELDRKLALPKGPEADKELPGAMWTALLFNTRLDTARDVLKLNMLDLPNKPEKFKQYMLYAAYSFVVMDDETDPEILGNLTYLLRNHGDKFADREFAMIAYGILRGRAALGLDPEAEKAKFRQPLLNHIASTRMKATNPGDADKYDPRIEALLDELSIPRVERVMSRPPLEDLLAWSYTKGKPVAFSFQRVDRRHPGLIVIRDASGRFVRREDGTIFSLAQLANARTDMPGTITNGNTPQGVFTIVGTGTAENRWIGPTAYLASEIPFEAPFSDFRHAPSDEQWSINLYNEFLPPSWHGYKPMQEAWLAGKAGRSEMLCHGTTINPEYYVGEPYYPFTPSAGCLVTDERWDKETGVLASSDQLTLVQAFVRAGGPRGYLVVVEIDDSRFAVNLDEVTGAIEEAEKRLSPSAQ